MRGQTFGIGEVEAGPLRDDVWRRLVILWWEKFNSICYQLRKILQEGRFGGDLDAARDQTASHAFADSTCC